MLQFERQAWGQGFTVLAGVDEAGRGPLAGPVVAAAVVFDRDFLEAEQYGVLHEITDSKCLSESKRDELFAFLSSLSAVRFSVGCSSVEEIDRINILKATHQAMARALQGLAPAPDCALVDGLPVPGLPCRSIPIVRGDALSLSIAAASIVAKVTRDHIMASLDTQYPHYGFSRHKGYGTKAHLQSLLEHGPCPEHRLSFRPVREVIRMRRTVGGDFP